VQTVHTPAVAGTFYPDDPDELAGTVATLLAAAKPTGHRPKALIVPHAGYIYSGAIAAAAFAAIAPYAKEIRRVVMLGPAHREFVDGFASPDARRMASPLGEHEIDVEAIARLGIAGNASAHANEHCLEVMLPFLHAVMPHATLIPLIGSRATPEETARLLASLWGGPETLILISSDLSHFQSYDRARERDARTAARILVCESNLVGEDACGALAIDGLTWLAREHHLRVEQLALCNSGDTAGSRDRVVGYGAFAFYTGEGP
jgi:AmmeMemoRadiSam system protein B